MAVIRFRRADPAALAPMPADKSALGSLPTAAYQYCEAVRTASAFGWYIFAPADIRLRFDGAAVLHLTADGWQPLDSAYLDDSLPEHWDRHAPLDLVGQAPAHLTALFVPGVVQVWSGLLVSTAEGWSVLVRPVVNFASGGGFQCYEGLVETDVFHPCPLFVNLRLLTTAHEVVIARDRPLFQVQPISRACYSPAALCQQEPGDLAGMADADWAGLRRTTRSGDPLAAGHVSGAYGGEVRRRTKRGDAPAG